MNRECPPPTTTRSPSERVLSIVVIGVLLMLFLPAASFAGGGAGGVSLPWDATVAALVGNIINKLGPAAMLFGLFWAGSSLFLSRTKEDGMWKGVLTLLGGSVITFAPTFLSALGVSGAMV